MSTVFCSSCGAKHQHAGFPPNFCSKCGSPMTAKAVQQSSARAQAPKVSAPADDEELSEDQNDINELPRLDRLDVEISIEGGFRAFSLEELSSSPATARTQKFKPIRRDGVSDLSPQKYGSSKNEAQD